MLKKARNRFEDLKQKIAGAVSGSKQPPAAINSSMGDSLESIPLNTPPSPELDAANGVFRALVEEESAPDPNQQTAASSEDNDGGRARSDSMSSLDLDDEYTYTAHLLEPSAAANRAPKNSAETTFSDPTLSSAPVNVSSPAMIVQANANDSDEPLAAAPVFEARQKASAPRRGPGGGGVDGYLKAIEASHVSEPIKLSPSGLFKYCRDNPKQTAVAGLGLAAVGGLAATGVAMGALALGAEAAIAATASVFTGLLTSASASAAVVKVNKPEIIEHVANQEEKARLELVQQEQKAAHALSTRHDMAHEDIDKVILKIAMLFVAANESKESSAAAEEPIRGYGEPAKALLKQYVIAYNHVYKGDAEVREEKIMQLVYSILNIKGLGYYGFDLLSNEDKIEQFLRDNGCDDADGMAALFADILDQEKLAGDIKACLKAPKALPPKIAERGIDGDGITCIKVYTGLDSEFITVRINPQNPEDTINKHIVEVAMRFIGGGKRASHRDDQTDEWFSKHGQTAKAWLKAYVAAYHNIFENTVAQENIVKLVCGILDKSKLKKLGIKESDIATIECGWYHNFCETPTKMAAWLCADEEQQRELVSNMEEHNSYARDKAEAAIAETLLAEIKVSQLQGENGEHDTPLAGGNDDTPLAGGIDDAKEE